MGPKGRGAQRNPVVTANMGLALFSGLSQKSDVRSGRLSYTHSTDLPLAQSARVPLCGVLGLGLKSEEEAEGRCGRFHLRRLCLPGACISFKHRPGGEGLGVMGA